MKIWILHPFKPIETRDVADGNAAFVVAREVIGRVLDTTRVIWDGQRRIMLVDDNGMNDGLPVNKEATRAYHAACRPGTTHCIHGTTVILARDI